MDSRKYDAITNYIQTKFEHDQRSLITRLEVEETEERLTIITKQKCESTLGTTREESYHGTGVWKSGKETATGSGKTCNDPPIHRTKMAK